MTISKENALWKLKDGNTRYLENRLSSSENIADVRIKVIDGQNPFAVVLTCSDSRVVPEYLFDCSLGELFIIRVAGNILSPEVLGSIDYAVEHLGSPLVIVLGHSSCGAVTAAVKSPDAGGNIKSLIDKITPAITNKMTDSQNDIDELAKENVHHVVSEMKNSGPVLDRYNNNGTIDIIGAWYNLEDGSVTFFE